MINVLEALAGYLKVPEIASFDKEKGEVGQININRLTDELHKNTFWLVFDDLNTILEDRSFIDKGLENLFFSLHNNTHESKILITSRIIPMFKNGGSLIDLNKGEDKQKLEGLTIEFAIDFLVQSGFKETDTDQLKVLAERVGGHPLALYLLVSLSKSYSVDDILRETILFQDEKGAIKNTRRLFDKLAGNEKKLLERISVYREPVKLQAITEMRTQDIPVNSIRNLIEKSLLETDNAGKYWLHPLIKEFSYEDLENKEETHSCAAKYYKSLIPQGKPYTKNLIQPVIEAHYHYCKARKYDEAASFILDSNFNKLLNDEGYSRKLIETYELMLPEEDSKGNSFFEKQTYGDILSNLGNARRYIGEPRKAIKHYNEAVKIAEKNNNKKAEGINLGYLGDAYRNLGELRKAIEYYDQAVKIVRDIKDRRSEGINLGNLGIAYSDLGETEESIKCYEEALEISRFYKDRREEGNYLGNLGSAYRNLGEYKEAIKYYNESINILHEAGDRRRKGNHLGNLGSTYRDLGDEENDKEKRIGYYHLAAKYHSNAIKILRSVGDKRREGNHLSNLGSVCLALDKTDEAIEHCRAAQTILLEAEDTRGIANNINILGSVCLKLGNPKKAIRYYNNALEIQEKIENKRGVGNNLRDLGFAYSELGDSGKAIENLRKALSIGKEIKDPRIINRCEQKIKSLQESEMK